MIGFSMGGIETWLAAAVDERIKVAVPAIGVQSFRWSLENDKWQGRANTIKRRPRAAAKDLGEPMVNQKVCRELWSKVIPGILDQLRLPEHAAAVRRPAADDPERHQGRQLPAMTAPKSPSPAPNSAYKEAGERSLERHRRGSRPIR